MPSDIKISFPLRKPALTCHKKTGTTKYNHSVPNKNVLHVLMTYMFFPCTTIAQKVLTNVTLFWAGNKRRSSAPTLANLVRLNLQEIWHKRMCLSISFISRSRSSGYTRGALLIEIRKFTLKITYWPYGLYHNACFELKHFLTYKTNNLSTHICFFNLIVHENPCNGRAGRFLSCELCYAIDPR